MTGRGHFISGLVFSIFSYKFTQDVSGIAILGAIGTMLGSNAPDYLEIRSKVYAITDGKKKCVGTKTFIKHRTITHWLPIWLFIVLFSLINLNYNFDNSFLSFFDKDYLNFNFIYSNFVFSFLLGYGIGGLLHLLTDIPNPMGIPILTPWKRFSLNLWKSGKMEPVIIVSLFVFCLYYLDVIILNYETVKSWFV